MNLVLSFGNRLSQGNICPAEKISNGCYQEGKNCGGLI